jgi:hypothetical protein
MNGPGASRRARPLGAALTGLAIAAALPVAAQPIPTGRGDVLLRRDCRSTIAREEVTLFGNGTVRLRNGPRGEERMVLVEVTRDEVESLVAALRAEDFSEAGAGSAGPEGDWVERCLLELPVLAAAGAGDAGSGDAGSGDAGSGAPGSDLTGTFGSGSGHVGVPRPDQPLGPGRPSGDRPATRFRYGHLDSLSLPLARVVALVDELAARVAAGAAAGRLPAGYRPRQGDVLRRADGVLFRVVRATEAFDELPGGWELQGVVQPLALYIFEADLPLEFVELVSRDEAHGP